MAGGRMLQTKRRNNPVTPLGVACGIVALYDFWGQRNKVFSKPPNFFILMYAKPKINA